MMHRLWLAVVLLGTLTCAGSTVSATVPNGSACCACLGGLDAPQALFCAEGTIEELVARCDALGGVLKCIAEERGNELQNNDHHEPTCGAQLTETGAHCPIANGAPTASAPALGALALACAAVGIWKVRRRSAAMGG
jgi:hypothetical protein